MLLNKYDCHDRIDSLGLSKEYIAASNLERRGWVIRNISNPETVAQHSISAALLVTQMFRTEILSLGINILALQDTLLIHDIQEPDKRVGDITPYDNISLEEKRSREMDAIHDILKNNPYLLKLWIDYEEQRTPEGKLGVEIDKFQAILKARSYEDDQNKSGLVEEFFTYSVVHKQQIQTQFLLEAAIELYENKPR